MEGGHRHPHRPCRMRHGELGPRPLAARDHDGLLGLAHAPLARGNDDNGMKRLDGIGQFTGEVPSCCSQIGWTRCWGGAVWARWSWARSSFGPLSSAVQSIASWFTSDGGGFVEEVAKEVATSWLEE